MTIPKGGSGFECKKEWDTKLVIKFYLIFENVPNSAGGTASFT
jgi:hypothetical protein